VGEPTFDARAVASAIVLELIGSAREFSIVAGHDGGGHGPVLNKLEQRALGRATTSRKNK